MQRLVALPLLALPLLGGMACSSSTAPGGMTQVVLTDDPFPTTDVRSVDIYVVSVAVSPSGDTLVSPSDWITVAEPHKRFDLMTLQNGTTALLGETQLAAGAYNMVRVVLNTDSSSITWTDGHQATIHWGSPGEISIHPMVEQPLGIAPVAVGKLVVACSPRVRPVRAMPLVQTCNAAPATLLSVTAPLSRPDSGHQDFKISLPCSGGKPFPPHREDSLRNT